MNKISIILIALALLLMPAEAPARDELLIGLIPESNIFKQMDRHRPLADYLSGKLGVKVKLSILSRYGDIIDKFATRKMDGAFFGVFTGAIAMEKLGVEPVAMPVYLDGTSTVSSYIFARKDSGIRTVKDMKGMRAVFVDRASLTGYLFILAFLRDNRVQDLDDFFKEYNFAGSHRSVVYSVLDNRADIGVAKSSVYKNMTDKDPVIRDELVILAQSGEFPDVILCVKKDLPAEIKKKIKNALLNMWSDAKGKEVLKEFGALRFIPADKKDFLLFYDMAGRAGIDIKKYKYKK